MSKATDTLTLTGITRAHGLCACCGRTLGRVFELSDGNTYGRRCAAKLTGYKVTDQAVRMAAHAAKREAAIAELAAASELFASQTEAGADGFTTTTTFAAEEVLCLYTHGQLADIAEAIDSFTTLAARNIY